MAGMNEIAREACLNPVTIDDGVYNSRGKNLDTTEQLERLFELIIEKCAEGDTVRIKNFGTFKMRTMKGRTLKSPLMPDGEVTFPDTQVLRFHQSTVAKEKLNQLSPAVPVEAKKAKKKPTKNKAKKKVVKKKG